MMYSGELHTTYPVLKMLQKHWDYLYQRLSEVKKGSYVIGIATPNLRIFECCPFEVFYRRNQLEVIRESPGTVKREERKGTEVMWLMFSQDFWEQSALLEAKYFHDSHVIISLRTDLSIEQDVGELVL